jgi:vacuolar protein sorting-associated protein VTA1
MFPVPPEDLPDLKSMAPFINRANELIKVDTVMSYYCLFYSLRQALQLKNRTKSMSQYLNLLMDNLEKVRIKKILIEV